MRKIMLVEDNPAAVRRMKQYIKNIDPNLEIHAFAEAGAAYRFAQKELISLFILDIQLTDYKGTSLAKQIRSLPQYKYTPIIFETVLAGEELSAYRDVKCYGFLIKPFGEEEFSQAFCDALGMSEHMEEPSKTIRIEQKQFVLEYVLGEIVFVEAFGKKLVIHTNSLRLGKKQDTISGYTLSGLLDLLGDPAFVRCHKSYLVNRKHIEKIDKANKLIFLREFDTPIPIGNKYYTEL